MSIGENEEDIAPLPTPNSSSPAKRAPGKMKPRQTLSSYKRPPPPMVLMKKNKQSDEVEVDAQKTLSSDVDVFVSRWRGESDRPKRKAQPGSLVFIFLLTSSHSRRGAGPRGQELQGLQRPQEHNQHAPGVAATDEVRMCEELKVHVVTTPNANTSVRTEPH